MLNKLPPLKSLLAFSAASRTKNFSHAAIELCITQSAVSHQIKNLENFLGHKLFYRQGKQLKLTEEGKIYAQTINQSLAQIMSITKQLTGQLDNALQFGVSSTYAVHKVTPELSQLNQKYPKLDIRLRMLSCNDPVIDLDLDIILYDNPIQHIAYECEKLKQEIYYPVASAKIAKKLEKIPPELWYKQTKLIDLQDLDSWNNWFEQNQIKRTKIETAYFSHTILMLQAALSHQGVALLGESLISQELASGQLVKLSQKSVHFENDGFYFFWHKRRNKDQNVRIIKNWLHHLLNG
ncbi:LysR family transcriptional regulator [Aliikangiella sp. IMCC44359]|uniref:LysR family transcriptional regulator n=1 Tax=Aliikangiella sp. IMCC44359 TaxID=3459125 RepID=UPI00403B039F